MYIYICIYTYVAGFVGISSVQASDRTVWVPVKATQSSVSSPKPRHPAPGRVDHLLGVHGGPLATVLPC